MNNADILGRLAEAQSRLADILASTAEVKASSAEALARSAEVKASSADTLAISVEVKAIVSRYPSSLSDLALYRHKPSADQAASFGNPPPSDRSACK